MKWLTLMLYRGEEGKGHTFELLYYWKTRDIRPHQEDCLSSSSSCVGLESKIEFWSVSKTPSYDEFEGFGSRFTPAINYDTLWLLAGLNFPLIHSLISYENTKHLTSCLVRTHVYLSLICIFFGVSIAAHALMASKVVYPMGSYDIN